MKPRPAIVSAFGLFSFGIRCLSTICSTNEKRYVPAVPPSQVEARHLIPPHVDISALAPFEGTLPGFRVHYQPSSAANVKAEEAVELPEDCKFYNPTYFILILTTFRC